jgi:DNA-binding Xre family transcriptional regulator
MIKVSKLKQIRMEKGLKVEHLAEMLGVTKQAVYCWERGVSAPVWDNLEKLCEVLECSVPDLI